MALALGATGARAELVGFEFEATVVSIFDPTSAYALIANPGDQAFGQFRYYTETPDLLPDDPTQGLYRSDQFFHFSVNGVVFEKEGFLQYNLLHNSQGREVFALMGRDGPTQWGAYVPPGYDTELRLAYWQTSPPFTLLEDDRLPAVPDFSMADGGTVFARTFSPEGALVFEMELRMVPVPEPGIWALLALGIAGWCCRMRRG